MREVRIRPTRCGRRVAYEYRLWDAELNQIYQAIMAVLPDEETDTLRGRERRWIRERDTAAKQAAERYKGGTMENVEYTASLANSTRDRAYELLDLYEIVSSGRVVKKLENGDFVRHIELR